MASEPVGQVEQVFVYVDKEADVVYVKIGDGVEELDKSHTEALGTMLTNAAGYLGG
jgi:hypothetical protein